MSLVKLKKFWCQHLKLQRKEAVFPIKADKKSLVLSMVISMYLLLTGCDIARTEPSMMEETAAKPSKSWRVPCCEPNRFSPVLPEEEAIEEEWKQHQGPWKAVDLVDIALRNNPLTHQSWQTARSYAFNWRASQSTLYPTVDLTEELLFQKISGTGAAGFVDATQSGTSDLNADTNTTTAVAGGGAGRGSTYNQWVISSLSASYLLLDFGGRCASIESARQALLSANWTHNRTIQSVILTVLTNYYQYLQAKALFIAKQDDVKNAQENVDAAEGQFKAGVKAKLDVLLAKSNLASTQLQLEQDRGAVKITLGNLATSLGLPANEEFEVEELPKDINLEKIHNNIEGLIAIAKQLRPDLGAAEADWKKRKQNVTVAWSQGLPTITANFNAQSVNNIHFPQQNSRLYSGSLFLDVPIFSGFLYVNQTRSAQALADASYAAWKQIEENVILDVVTSYYNFRTAEQTVKSSDEYYEYTKEAYDVAFASYKNGVGTILDLLSAQVALSNAKAQKIQARTQWVTSLTNVAYATGQL